ncbi:YusG family protein [Neobacillus sp. FSL H8-0543]|uniref:YusG family protein n=1 Tax=Neobacillus sp. FSL H8-0543 TaxID=2954672 RepID=UPI00315988A1
MTLNHQKIDVTDRVIGKLKNGEIELFFENTSIGKIQMPGNDMSFQLDHHFEVDQRKIYQNVTVTEQPEPKYTDCDDGGWC